MADFQEIELPDGSIAEFPADMSDAEITSILQGETQPPQAAVPDPVWRNQPMSPIERVQDTGGDLARCPVPFSTG